MTALAETSLSAYELLLIERFVEERTVVCGERAHNW